MSQDDTNPDGASEPLRTRVRPVNRSPAPRMPRRGFRSLRSPTPPESNPGVACEGPEQDNDPIRTKSLVVSVLLGSGEVRMRRGTGSRTSDQKLSPRSLPVRSKPRVGRSERSDDLRRWSSGREKGSRQDGSIGAYGSFGTFVACQNVASVPGRFEARKRRSGLHLILSR